jgi:hypothetical protein
MSSSPNGPSDRSRNSLATGSLVGQSSRFIELPGSTPVWLLVGALLALASGWLFQFSVNPDGVVYLDMAENALRSGPAQLLNVCWGGFYPALIALALHLFHPATAQARIAAVHWLNAVLLVVALAAFMAFVQRQMSGERSGRRSLVVSLCAVFFLWLTASISSVRTMTPDLRVFVLVFWTADLALGIHLPSRASWRAHAVLGVTIGLGYYVKQMMLPAGGLLLLVLAIMPPKLPQARWKLAVTAAAFLLVTAPFAAWLSMKTGHLTFSENGRLNRLWHVEEIPMVPSGAASYAAYLRCRPRQTPSVVVEKPLTIGFEKVAQGTYPLVYSPADWFVGVEPRFNLKRQILVYAGNVRNSVVFLLEFRCVWLGLLVLAIWSFAKRRPGTVATPGLAAVVLWCIGTCIAICAVHVEARYLAPFVAVAVAIGYAEVTRTLEFQSYWALLVTLAVTLAIPATQDIVSIKAEFLRASGQARPGYLDIARDLQAAGLKSGGKIAVVGFASDAYYAKVTDAQIPDEKSFWQATEAERQNVQDRLRQLGVTMIAAPAKPAGLRTVWPGFDRELDKPYSVFALNGPSGSAAVR